MAENKTFKEMDKENRIIKRIKKVGLSLGLVFSLEELKRFNLSYNDEIDLSNAEIIKSNPKD